MVYIECKSSKRLFKTTTGVEIRPSLLSIDEKTNWQSDLTYYYAWYYYDKQDLKWKVGTNKLLFGEFMEIVVCKDKDEAIKIAESVNSFIRLLIENI